MFFSASISLESSPPEAMRLSGFRGSPGLGEIRKETSSSPAAFGRVGFALFGAKSTLNRVEPMPRSASCSVIPRSKRSASATRASVSARAACR